MICATLTGLASHAGVSSVSFQSGVRALEYLRTCSELPLAYFVDMRIPGSKEELNSPEEVFNYLKTKGKIDYFNFMTGHISEHDEGVQERTGARILLKPLEVFHGLTKVLGEIKLIRGY